MGRLRRPGLTQGSLRARAARNAPHPARWRSGALYRNILTRRAGLWRPGRGDAEGLAILKSQLDGWKARPLKRD